MTDNISVPRELRQVLGTILNALDRDALEGKTVRGEMAQELRALLSAPAVEGEELEAESHGITSFDEANEWLEARQQNDAVMVPRAIAERMAIDAAQYEHEHAVVHDNVQLWQQPSARLTLTVGDLRTVRALLASAEGVKDE